MAPSPKNFGKIMRQIYGSSVAVDWKVMITFQQFIILADWDGIVDQTALSISRMTGIPMDIIEHGIAELEKPDESSRSPALDGRRITRLDDHRNWGWQIVNHEFYLQQDQDRKEYMRKYMQERRAKEKEEKEKKQAKKQRKAAPTQQSTVPGIDEEGAVLRFKFPAQRQIPKDFCITEYTRNWCQKNQHKPKPELYLEAFKEHFEMKGTRYVDWDRTFTNWIRNTLPGGHFYKPPGKNNGHNGYEPKRQTSTPRATKDIAYYKQEISHAENMMKSIPESQHAPWQKMIDTANNQIRQLQSKGENNR